MDRRPGPTAIVSDIDIRMIETTAGSIGRVEISWAHGNPHYWIVTTGRECTRLESATTVVGSQQLLVEPTQERDRVVVMDNPIRGQPAVRGDLGIPPKARRDLVGEQPLLAGVAAPDLDADAAAQLRG